MLNLHVNDEISLRIVEEDQAAELFKLVDDNRPHLDPWLPWVETTKTVADTKDFIAKSHQEYKEGVTVPLGIWYHDRLIGHISANNIVAKHKVEIGYWVAAESEGKGIMTQAVARLVDHAFNDLHLERVVIRCRTTNSRSQAVPKRLGFTFEGVLRHEEYIHDTYHDLRLYSLLASEHSHK